LAKGERLRERDFVKHTNLTRDARSRKERGLPKGTNRCWQGGGKEDYLLQHGGCMNSLGATKGRSPKKKLSVNSGKGGGHPMREKGSSGGRKTTLQKKNGKIVKEER